MKMKETAEQLFKKAEAFYQQGNVDEAIKVLKQIKPNEKEWYAKAQLNLGDIYTTQGNIKKAIVAYKKVSEIQAEHYALAQLTLGIIYKGQGKLEDTIIAWKNVPENQIEQYTLAQLSLGIVYTEQEKLEEAIEAYKKVPKNQIEYNLAQLHMGFIYEEQKNLEDAIIAWQNVSQNQIEEYSQAQLGLGCIYEKQENLEEAIEAYKNVPENQIEQYTQAQLSLGRIYYKQENLKDAIEAYKNVFEGQIDLYVLAQLSLGRIYYKQENLKDAIEAYKNVLENQMEPYTLAQLSLGKIYYEQENLKDAIEAYKNVSEDQIDLYALAQLCLGGIYYKQENLKDAIEAYKNVPQSQIVIYNQAQLYLKILNSHNRDDLLSLIKNKNNILNKLQVTAKNFNGVELNIAHYTRPSTAFAILEKNKDEKVSPFRLSSINGVNDPTEGDVLYKWLGFSSEKNENLAVFISCFTFNHDSLNQFRLYGKENNEEATGVSLVLNGQKFFEQIFDITFGINLSYIVPNNEIIKLQDIAIAGNTKLPLYRCIYLDLESLELRNNEYVSLSSREKITFYREKSPNLTFNKYKQGIDYLVSKVKKELIAIKNIVKNITDDGDKKIIDEILLPIRYLVKHAAFENEQEARMFYITSLFDPKIQTSEDNTQMYVEYEQEVKPAIHKMYLSPGAEKYKDFFRRILENKGGRKVEVSCNPFRNKKY